MKTAHLTPTACGSALGTSSLAGLATLLAFGLAGCKSNTTPAPIVNNSAAADTGGPDPADANMASGSGGTGQPTQVMGQSQSYTPQQQGENYNYQQAPAPVQQGYSNAPAYPQQQGYDNSGVGYSQGYTDGEAAEAATAPPPLPVYEQPPAPDPNDLWTPGYWNYGDGGYYWVPGTWVAAPYYGALWTPPYWGFYGGRYRFHHGYWGPHIGFYGGINYGFGYIGVGYYGGYWRGHDFFYNREVNRVGSGFGNVYERPVVVNNIRYNNVTNVRVSYNGGPGGINAQPRPFEVAAAREQHVGPVAAQVALRTQAAGNRGNFFAQNQGRPQQVAFAHPPEAHAPLPANTPMNNGSRIGESNQTINRPGGAVGNAAVNRPGAAQPGFTQPLNRPGQPNTHVGTPGEAGNQLFNRPGQPGAQGGVRPEQPRTPTTFNRPGEPGGQGGVRQQPAPHIGTPAQPGNQPGGFNRQAVPDNRGGRPAEPANRPAPAANPGFNRPAPAVSRPAPAAAPAPHVEAARPAPAPAPHAAPAPAPHAAPAPAAAPHGEGGGHPR